MAGTGPFRAPKWASKLPWIAQGVTQHGAEEMGAVWQTWAERERAAWDRWEAFRLDLAREERDKSVGDILVSHDTTYHPRPRTLGSVGTPGLLLY